jgi:tetratricopeptide (TPR) repeat protein
LQGADRHSFGNVPVDSLPLLGYPLTVAEPKGTGNLCGGPDTARSILWVETEVEMELNASIKNKISRTVKDPWSCVLGRRPEGYSSPDIGLSLIESVDKALFERDYEEALTVSIILKKWSQRRPDFSALAEVTLGGVFTVCGLVSLAERKLENAKRKIDMTQSTPCCIAEYHRRYGIFLLHQARNKEAIGNLGAAFEEFTKEGEILGAAKSVIAQGVARWKLRDHENALKDEERGIRMLDDFVSTSYVTIQALANIALLKIELGRIDEAVGEIEAILEAIKGDGSQGAERTRIILRWLRALVLEVKGKMKSAGQILDRVETRLKKLDMKSELRVLLADRARVARSEPLVKRIAGRALEMETEAHVRKILEAVIDSPSAENLQLWRKSLDTYVPMMVAATQSEPNASGALTHWLPSCR